ncbi:unnamed protein product [Auanema sp. JU1783]|nr:unnamed protein product [Auanema sp. JU1783]
MKQDNDSLMQLIFPDDPPTVTKEDVVVEETKIIDEGVHAHTFHHVTEEVHRDSGDQHSIGHGVHLDETKSIVLDDIFPVETRAIHHDSISHEHGVGKSDIFILRHTEFSDYNENPVSHIVLERDDNASQISVHSSISKAPSSVSIHSSVSQKSVHASDHHVETVEDHHEYHAPESFHESNASVRSHQQSFVQSESSENLFFGRKQSYPIRENYRVNETYSDVHHGSSNDIHQIKVRQYGFDSSDVEEERKVRHVQASDDSSSTNSTVSTVVPQKLEHVHEHRSPSIVSETEMFHHFTTEPDRISLNSRDVHIAPVHHGPIIRDDPRPVEIVLPLTDDHKHNRRSYTASSVTTTSAYHHNTHNEAVHVTAPVVIEKKSHYMEQISPEEELMHGPSVKFLASRFNYGVRPVNIDKLTQMMYCHPDGTFHHSGYVESDLHHIHSTNTHVSNEETHHVHKKGSSHVSTNHNNHVSSSSHTHKVDPNAFEKKSVSKQEIARDHHKHPAASQTHGQNQHSSSHVHDHVQDQLHDHSKHSVVSQAHGQAKIHQHGHDHSRHSIVSGVHAHEHHHRTNSAVHGYDLSRRPVVEGEHGKDHPRHSVSAIQRHEVPGQKQPAPIHEHHHSEHSHEHHHHKHLASQTETEHHHNNEEIVFESEVEFEPQQSVAHLLGRYGGGRNKQEQIVIPDHISVDRDFNRNAQMKISRISDVNGNNKFQSIRVVKNVRQFIHEWGHKDFVPVSPTVRSTNHLEAHEHEHHHKDHHNTHRDHENHHHYEHTHHHEHKLEHVHEHGHKHGHDYHHENLREHAPVRIAESVKSSVYSDYTPNQQKHYCPSVLSISEEKKEEAIHIGSIAERIASLQDCCAGPAKHHGIPAMVNLLE